MVNYGITIYEEISPGCVAFVWYSTTFGVGRCGDDICGWWYVAAAKGEK